jgi:pimeloyl-ACP methyl ester carboxylesterase
MTVPLFFGEGRRRLFGVYDPAIGKAAASAGGARAIVFCGPWGPDYYVAHGALRRLATNLALAGHHVLRFDYFGVGDSGGESNDSDFEGWCSDVAMAVDELKSMTRIARVCLVGLRLGATLAATVAADRRDINALVLWDPIVRGHEYLEELSREHTAWLNERTRYVSFPDTDVQNRTGDPLPGKLERQIAAIDLPRLAPSLQQKTLLVITEKLRSHEAFAATTDSRRMTIEHVADRLPWRFDTLEFGGPLPKVALTKIMEWLG